jgi:hypothetical protein
LGPNEIKILNEIKCWETKLKKKSTLKGIESKTNSNQKNKDKNYTNINWHDIFHFKKVDVKSETRRKKRGMKTKKKVHWSPTAPPP